MNRLRLGAALAMLLLAASGDVPLWAAAPAEPFLGAMRPQSVARGQATRVRLVGTGLERAIGLWTSAGSGVTAERVPGSPPGTVEFDVRVTSAELGLHGLRVATEHGLTNPVIFLVDDLAPQSLEPNANPPTAVRLPAAVAGVFRPTEIDRYSIDVKAGDEVSFECVASRFGKDADPLLRIRDAGGRVVVEYDNDPGLFFDFRFAHRFAEAGRYTVELCDARFHGHEEWSYVLRMGRFPAARVAVPSVMTPGRETVLGFPELPGVTRHVVAVVTVRPGDRYFDLRREGDDVASWIATRIGEHPPATEAEPNDKPEQASPAGLPSWLSGVFGTPGDVDHFAVELKKGDRLALRAEAAAIGSPADVELAVIDPDGRELQRIDDVLLEEASLTVNINRDGIFKVLAHDVTRGGGPAYAYRIDARLVKPQIELTADFAELTIPQGDYQSLPLRLTRTDYAGPVALSLVSLQEDVLPIPHGIVLEPAEIPAGQNTLWARVRADAKSPLGLATLRVVATAEAETKRPAAGAMAVGGGIPIRRLKLSAVARTAPLVDRQLLNVDLLKYALRENQRRLPPSLSSTIALQVTPPAPFSVELPEPAITLVRFLSAEFPIHTARRGGFAGELAFKAVGGQLGEESEIRRQVYTRFTPATADKLTASGTFYSRNLPNDAKDRVDLSAVGVVDGRRIELIRSFDLDLKGGFDVTVEPSSVTVAPGETAAVRLVAGRVGSFTGPITIEPQESPGLNVPAKIEIPSGADGVDVKVAIPADFAPRRVRIRYQASGKVGQFVEEPRPKDIEINVKIPEPPKPPKPAAAKPQPAKPRTGKK
jgi:hypothetical protein